MRRGRAVSGRKPAVLKQGVCCAAQLLPAHAAAPAQPPAMCTASVWLSFSSKQNNSLCCEAQPPAHLGGGVVAPDDDILDLGVVHAAALRQLLQRGHRQGQGGQGQVTAGTLGVAWGATCQAPAQACLLPLPMGPAKDLDQRLPQAAPPTWPTARLWSRRVRQVMFSGGSTGRGGGGVGETCGERQTGKYFILGAGSTGAGSIAAQRIRSTNTPTLAAAAGEQQPCQEHATLSSAAHSPPILPAGMEGAFSFRISALVLAGLATTSTCAQQRGANNRAVWVGATGGQPESNAGLGRHQHMR